MQGGHLRGVDWPQVGVPFAPLSVVVVEGLVTKLLKFSAGQRFRRDSGWCIDEAKPALFSGECEIVQAGFSFPRRLRLFRHHASSRASA